MLLKIAAETPTATAAATAGPPRSCRKVANGVSAASTVAGSRALSSIRIIGPAMVRLARAPVQAITRPILRRASCISSAKYIAQLAPPHAHTPETVASARVARGVGFRVPWTSIAGWAMSAPSPRAGCNRATPTSTVSAAASTARNIPVTRAPRRTCSMAIPVATASDPRAMGQ
jgi:hypothetical protein